MWLLLRGSAWRPTWRSSAASQLRALGYVAGRRLFAGGPALPAGLILQNGAGQTGKGLWSAGIWAQLSFMLFCLFSLVFFLPLSGRKVKEEEEKFKKLSSAQWSVHGTEILRGATTAQVWKFTFSRSSLFSDTIKALSFYTIPYNSMGDTARKNLTD